MYLSPSNLIWLDAIKCSVDDYLKSKSNDVSKVIDTLKMAMPRITRPSTTVTVDIIEPMHNKAFIMSIYPDIAELDRLSQPIFDKLNQPYHAPSDPMKNVVVLEKSELNRAWSSIKLWHIEIDKRILSKHDRLCVSNGNEFVALLCHELGHVHITNPISFANNYRMSRAKLSAIDQATMVKLPPIIKKFLLTALVHTLSFRIVILDNLNSSITEIKADSFVPDQYKPFLVSYMEDHILNSPERSDIVVTATDFDKEQTTAIDFCNECIKLARTRCGVLKTRLFAQYRLTPSKYLKQLCAYIANKSMGIKNINNPAESIMTENYMIARFNDSYDRVLTEVKHSIPTKSKVSDRDIMILTVEKDNIATPEDKMYVINTIYDYIDIITTEIERKCNKHPNLDYKEEVAKDKRLAILNDIRADVMNTKVSRDGAQYGLFIKYPEGYEG